MTGQLKLYIECEKHDYRVLVVLLLVVIIFSGYFTRVMVTSYEDKRLQSDTSCEKLSFNELTLVQQECTTVDEYIRYTPATLTPFFFKKIPVNVASRELLQTVRGIGPVTAEKIVKFREVNGLIEDAATLMEIEGIGPSRSKQFANHLSFTNE